MDYQLNDSDYLDNIVNTYVDGGMDATEGLLLGGGLKLPSSGGLSFGNDSGIKFSDPGSVGGFSLDGSGEGLNPPGSFDIGGSLGDSLTYEGLPSGFGSEDSSLLKSLEGWLKQNPNLAKLGLSGVAGLASAYSANKAGQNSIESLKEQEAQKLRTRERVSDSILGMAPFQVNGAQPLQRLDGTRVFGQDGKIMR